MRSAGMFAVDRTGAVIERATTKRALRDAYAMVHDVYVDKGYIRPQQGCLRLRTYEAMPETATFVARAGRRIVAVTSLVVDSPDLGLPSDHVFGEQLHELRQESCCVCEITNLAIHPDYRNTPVFLQLTQACFAHAKALGCENIFIAISPGHAGFFNEILQFDYWGPERDYGKELEDVEDIVQPMRLHVPSAADRADQFDALMGPEDAFLRDFYFAANPYHDRIGEWTAKSSRTFFDTDALRQLFVAGNGLLLRCSVSERMAIRKRWGREVFGQVLAREPAAPKPMRPASVAQQALSA